MEVGKIIFTDILTQLSFYPSVDHFASRVNTQLKRFSSYQPDPKAEAK